MIFEFTRVNLPKSLKGRYCYLVLALLIDYDVPTPDFCSALSEKIAGLGSRQSLGFFVERWLTGGRSLKRVFPQESAADSHSPISNGFQPGASVGSRRVQKSAAMLGIALSFGTSAPLLFEPESALAAEGPVVAVLPAAGSKAEVAQPTLVTNQSNLASTTYHTVEAGESLWQIAEEHQADLGSLKAANNIAPDEVLKVGQVLRVPSVIEGVAGAEGSEQVHRLALSGNVRGSVGGDLSIVFGEELPLGEDTQGMLDPELSADLDDDSLAKLDAGEEVQLDAAGGAEKGYELTAAALLDEVEDAAPVEVDATSDEPSVAALTSELPASMPLSAVKANPLEDLEVAAAESVTANPGVSEAVAFEDAPADVPQAEHHQVALSVPAASTSGGWSDQEVEQSSGEATSVETSKSLAVAALNNTPAGPESSLRDSAPVPNTRSYQVKAGDTFWNIAARHGLSLDELMRHNSGQSPGSLVVGANINLPIGAEEAASETSSSTLARASQLQSRDNRDAAIQDHLARIREAANRDVDPEELKARIIAVRESLERSESADVSSAPLEFHNGTGGDKDDSPAALSASQVSSQTGLSSQSLVARSSATAQSEWTVTDAANETNSVEVATLGSPAESVEVSEAALEPAVVPGNLMAAAPMSPDAYRVSPRLPVGDVVTPGMPILPESGEFLPEAPNRFNGYVWPTQGTLTSGYGWRWGRMHQGIDIAGPVGTPVMAAAPGVVVRSGWNSGGYGNLVDIRHADGSLTRYAHNSRLLVHEGQQVRQGQQIAEMGSTGYSTGPHLHFEVHLPNSGTVNPLAYLPGR